MARDNFTIKTKRLLGEASGFHCVRPGCGKVTKAYDDSSESMKNISISAHDAAASAGGPRYDASMTLEQRRAIDNGAWLCPTCARVVDLDAKRFPPGTISHWQHLASEYRNLMMRNPPPPMGLNFREACESAKAFIGYCQSIRYHPWDHCVSFRTINAIKKLNELMLPFDATNRLCTQFPHMVNLQKEIMRAIYFVREEVEFSGCWHKDLYFNNFVLLRTNYICPSKDEMDRNDRIKISKSLIDGRFTDFYSLLEDLKSIACSPSPPMDLYAW